MSEGGPLTIVFIVAGVVFSAFFSSSEAAFLSLQRMRIAHLVATGTPGAKRVAGMIEQPERLLSTILLGNNLVNVAFTALVTVMMISLVDDESLGVLLATVVGTAGLLVFGEIIPKTIAVRHSEWVAFLYARPLKVVETLLLPMVAVLQWGTRRLNNVLGTSLGRESITEGEFRTLIDIGEAEGTFEPAEAEMLENVFRFGDMQVREVMTPRTEIVAIERGVGLRAFLDIYAGNAHTRFPVYRGSPDNIIGILSAKDVLKTMSSERLDFDDPVTDIIRDAYFVPETKPIAELFHELRHSGNQMAIAVDEYAGLAGMVTLKRLSEEVVGPVGEEGMGPEEEYEAIDRNTFQVDGGMSIEEANEELGLVLPEGEYETIAGFVLEILGHIPAVGDRFEYHDLRFAVIEMDNLKIEAVRVTRSRQIDDGATNETYTD